MADTDTDTTPAAPNWNPPTGKLWEYYEGGSPTDAPPYGWEYLVAPAKHRSHATDALFDMHLDCPGCVDLIDAARMVAGACARCGSVSDVTEGPAWGSADVSFASCAACGWRSEP